MKNNIADDLKKYNGDEFKNIIIMRMMIIITMMMAMLM